MCPHVRAFGEYSFCESVDRRKEGKRQLYSCTFSNNHFSHKVVKFLQLKVYQKWLLNGFMSSSLDKSALHTLESFSNE